MREEREETDASKKNVSFQITAIIFLYVRGQQLQGILSCWIALSLSLSDSLSFFIDEMCFNEPCARKGIFNVEPHWTLCVFYSARKEYLKDVFVAADWVFAFSLHSSPSSIRVKKYKGGK